ncbi:MAG: hypothetical protein AAF661_15415 [Pseudomonadota bacterium]
MMQIPVEPVLALLGGLIILFNEKGLRDVARLIFCGSRPLGWRQSSRRSLGFERKARDQLRQSRNDVETIRSRCGSASITKP